MSVNPPHMLRRSSARITQFPGAADGADSNGPAIYQSHQIYNNPPPAYPASEDGSPHLELQADEKEMWEEEARVAAREAVQRRSSRSPIAKAPRTKSRKERSGRPAKPDISVNTGFGSYDGSKQPPFPLHRSPPHHSQNYSRWDPSDRRGYAGSKRHDRWTGARTDRRYGKPSEGTIPPIYPHRELLADDPEQPEPSSRRTGRDPNATQPLDSRRRHQLEASPPPGPISIGISRPPDAVSSFSAAFEPDRRPRRRSKSNTVDPTSDVVLTPAGYNSAWSPDTDLADSEQRPVRSSSIYSQAPMHINSANVDVPPIPALPWNAWSHRRRNTAQALDTMAGHHSNAGSTITAFEEDTKAPRHDRIASAYTEFEEDQMDASQTKHDAAPGHASMESTLVPTPRRSRGWWNVITTPFESSRASSLWTNRGPAVGEHSPVVPSITRHQKRRHGAGASSSPASPDLERSLPRHVLSSAGPVAAHNNANAPAQHRHELQPNDSGQGLPGASSTTSRHGRRDSEWRFPTTAVPLETTFQARTAADNSAADAAPGLAPRSGAHSNAIAEGGPSATGAAHGSTGLMPFPVKHGEIERADTRPSAAKLPMVEGEQNVPARRESDRRKPRRPPKPTSRASKDSARRNRASGSSPDHAARRDRWLGDNMDGQEEKRNGRGRKSQSPNQSNTTWLKRWFPRRGRDEEVQPKRKRGRRKRCCLWGCCCLVFLCIICLTVPLAVVFTRPHHGFGMGPSHWLNLTGYPPIPTGVSTIAEPEAAVEQSGCVGPATIWSCALPKEQQASASPNAPDQPNFEFQILFQNGTVADPSRTRVEHSRSDGQRRKASRASSFIRSRMLGIRAVPSPSPAPPSLDDQNFLGNTTEKNATPFQGEDTPFLVSFVAATKSGSKRVRRDGGPFENITNLIPPPSVNSDGTAAAAALYPLPSYQPLRLYNRGREDEHYGFYTYFERSLFLKSIAPTNSSYGGVPSDANGGSPYDAAAYRCTWSQTRFLVQMWTRSQTSKPLLRGAGGGKQAAAGSDFSRPGSFAYPVTLTIDRHGGNNTAKMIYCYGMDPSGRIDASNQSFVLEDRSFGGLAINPSDGPVQMVNGTVDGGSGGCMCQWVNWER